jgi:hypothetical protein
MLGAEARSPAGPGGVNGRSVQHEDPISVPKFEPDNTAARKSVCRAPALRGSAAANMLAWLT